MRDLSVPTSKSKLKLLDAAEEQIAKKGFDGVSVRDVTESAKANVAAVNYHFGSREGMMATVIVRRMLPVQQERLERLTALEKRAGSKAIPTEELLEAFIRPLVTTAERWNLKPALAHPLAARMLSLHAEALPESMGEVMAEIWKRFPKCFAKSLPDVSPSELLWRLHLVEGAVIQMLGATDSLVRWSRGAADEVSEEARLAGLLRFAAAGLREGQEIVAKKEKAGPQATFNF
ncbi:MAG TPA: TetR family transcriptional regulator [Luteolibacter sp.]|nr:TetR family transcriptional regulator [Luteolibacter sp.]